MIGRLSDIPLTAWWPVGTVLLVLGLLVATIPPTASGFAARQAQVYLPPAWSTPRQAPLPVVLLLHGTPGNPTDWVEGGQAQVTADAWASQHGGVAPVLVMPDINGSMTGDTERSLPWLAQRFGLVPATPAAACPPPAWST